MGRPVALVAVWLAAAVVCTTLGWVSAGLVAGEAQERRLPMIEAAAAPTGDAVRAPSAARTPSAQVSVEPSATALPSPAASASPSRPVPAPATSAPTGSAGVSPSPRPAAPSPAPSDDPSPPRVAPPPPAAASSPAPRTPAPPPAVRTPPPTASSTTISSRGGAVAVRYRRDTESVGLLWATPQPGFTMEVQKTGPDEVEVRFETDEEEWRVFAWWDGGPRQRVEEGGKGKG